jgi:hypothetical protein
MTTSGLPVELEATYLQLPNDFPVSESRQAAHSRGDHNRVVSALCGGRQIGHPVSLASSLNQFPSNVAGDVECLSNGPTLRDEAGEFIRGCEEQSFRQFLDLYPNR